MTKQRMTMNDELASAIAKATAAARGADRAKGVAIDLFRALGWQATDFMSPKSDGSTATEESYTWVKEQIVAGFTKPDQALLEANIKTLTDAQKARRRYAQMQIGARMSDFKKGLTQKDPEAGRNKPVLEFLDEHASAIMKRLESMTGEDAPKLDIPAALDLSQRLRATIRAASK